MKINRELIGKIRNFVEEECKKPTSKYGYEIFERHFIPVVKYAKILTNKFNADAEVVEISAWLHDIGSIIYGNENHHITGIEIAGNKLNQLNYPRQKIEEVKQCIFSHRGSKNIRKQSLESWILADADTISCFDNLEGLFNAAFIYEKLSQKEARKSVREKLKRKYVKLTCDYSREIVKPKFEAVMLLLK